MCSVQSVRWELHKYYIKADEKDNEVIAGELCYWIDREAIDRSGLKKVFDENH